jgi:coenzyme F420-dependent glucose-6-phosphate dehydrogenase
VVFLTNDLKIGYFTHEEQYCAPALLRFCVLAEKQRFDEGWFCDHFHPWAHTGANANFAWVLLAAAAERTKTLTLTTGVTAPILRYNPAIVAQAFATLGYLYPGRVILGVGTGEALNELPVGCYWPEPLERLVRLEEAVRIIRMLWKGEFVSMRGKYYSIRRANLYTKPAKPIPLYIAANGPRTAALAGRYADGWITSNFAPEYYREILFPALEKGARLADRDASKIRKVVQFSFTYGVDFERAIQIRKKYAAGLLPNIYNLNMYDPRELEAVGRVVDMQRLIDTSLLTSNPDDHIRILESYIELGFSGLSIGNLGEKEEEFLKMYGEKVIPYLKESFNNHK